MWLMKGWRDDCCVRVLDEFVKSISANTGGKFRK